MRNALATFLVLAACSTQAESPASATLRPDALMSALTAEVTATLKRDAAAGEPSDVARLVETKILPRFDFPHMTRIAVGRNWHLASPEQQAALVTHFRMLLVRTYSSALSTYRDEVIEYKPLRLAPGETDVLVRSVVRRPGAEALSLDYDMESTSAGWKVYDVKIAGVSLVMTYREAFAAAVRAGGIDGLIALLAGRNRQNESRPKGAYAQTGLEPVLLLPLVRGRP